MESKVNCFIFFLLLLAPALDKQERTYFGIWKGWRDYMSKLLVNRSMIPMDILGVAALILDLCC